MTIDIDENEVKSLIEQMVKWNGDESGFYYLANYVLGCLYEQNPDLKALADKRFE